MGRSIMQELLGHKNVKLLTIEETVKLLQKFVPNLNTKNVELVQRIQEKFLLEKSLTSHNISKIVTKTVGMSLSEFSTTSLNYWMKYGWSEELSEQKRQMYCESGRNSLNRYVDLCAKNPILAKRKSRMCEEYWVSRGYSKEYARKKISAISKEISKGLNPYLAAHPEKNVTKIEYWIAKGLTEKEAKEKISERQSTFSYEKCIEKYGKTEGYVVWLKRQKKWKNSLIKSGHWNADSLKNRKAFEKYKCEVWSYTKLQPIEKLDNSDKRGRGYRKGFQLDHILSMTDGFLQKIDPKIVGNIVNLRFIPTRENLVKHKRSHLSKEKLLELYEVYDGTRMDLSDMCNLRSSILIEGT